MQLDPDCLETPTLWPPQALPAAVEERKDPGMALRSVAGERRKDLGQFFTPPELVAALTGWAIRLPTDTVLEPAAGEAVFVEAALRRLRALGAQDPGGNVVGVELDSTAFATMSKVLADHGEQPMLRRQDFFDLRCEEFPSFTAVIGNPPYVRYHRFAGEAREKGRRAAAAAGVALSGLASSWAPFVIHSCRFLGADGRLALVLPAELLNANYATPVREYLMQRFGAVTIVTFEEAVFPGAMIDTVLLMAEGGARRGLRIVQLRDRSELGRLSSLPEYEPSIGGRWSSLRGGQGGVRELAALRERGSLRRLGDVCSVDIGFVTGGNDFFLLSSAEAKRYGLSRRLFEPAIARPGQLTGAILSRDEGKRLLVTDSCNLLRLSAAGLDERPTALGRYLRRGRRRGIHHRYKCSTRSPWYCVPGVHVPDAFMSYMSNATPRLVLNDAGFSSSNLVHQLNFHLTERAHMRAYITALHSSPALLSFEIEGRSYGGGVLKHDTRDAERVELPFESGLSDELAALLPRVDAAIRENGHGEAAAIVDSVLVRRGILSDEGLEAIRRSRTELHERRVTRGRTT